MNHHCYTKAAIILTIVCFFFSCNQNEKKEYKIGFSQCVTNDAWRKAMHEEINRELSFYPEFSLIVKDAQGNSELQVKQIEELIKEGIDLLIVSPNESEPITEVVEKYYLSGIPVIIMDRKITSKLYSAYIGGDNFAIGYNTGLYLLDIFPYKKKIVEIWGLPGSSPAKERNSGLKKALLGGDLEISYVVEGEWEKDISKERFKEFLLEEPDFDIVFAHNDVMAIGAKEVCESMGIVGKKFIGIDALPGPYGGIQAIYDGVLDASFIYPTGGEKAIEVARKILIGEPFEKENILQTAAVDSTNVRIMKQQTDRILNQQQNIFRQNEMLETQIDIYRSQRGLIFIFGFTLFISIISLAYVFKSLKDKQEINKKLRRNHKKLLIEQEKVKEYSRKFEEVTLNKIEFFTNISHEFRTPLTLIFAPLEEIINDHRSFDYRKNLNLIKKNTARLLLLVNQLMDFRKIDSDKMNIKVSEQKLIPFLEDITDLFKKVAKARKVSFKLSFQNPDLVLWFDPEMFDKIIFNLLSNAFKFCQDKGFVHVEVKEISDSGTVQIAVSNNGCQIDNSELPFVFDRFYQGKSQKRSFGTGVGLALTKELTELHSGSVSLNVNHLKTEFLLEFKLGNGHFEEHQIVPLEHQNFELDRNLNLMNFPLIEEEDINKEENPESNLDHFKESTLLILEDDPEIRSYLKKFFENEYFVIEATDTSSAFQLAKQHVPDIITCDLMLSSNSDGMEFIRDLKKDPITSSIPVVIITAKSSDQIRLEGAKNGAEDFIIKPFSITFLKERVKNILSSRKQLRKHYIHELPMDVKLKGEQRKNKSFTLEFSRLLESNIAEPDFGIDQICKELGLSRGQLYRKVKDNLGYSVHDYLLKVRLKKSKILLLDGGNSISEVASKVGFKSPAYFSTAFKNQFGLSPSDFLKERNREIDQY